MRINKLTTESTSNFGFFFLFLYTASVLIRAHEMFLVTSEWILIQVFAILALIGMIAGQRPLSLLPQHYLLISMIPLIIFSGFLNGSGMDGISQGQRLLISSIIPLLLYSNLIDSLSKQRSLMYISLFAALLMIHNGYSQHENYSLTERTGYGWAGSNSVGREEMRITYLGFFNDPNDLGMFLVMNIPFAAYFFSEKGKLKKLLMLATLSALFYGIYITGSRGTLLGAIGVVGAYFMVNKAGAKLILFSIIMAPIAATLIMSFGGISAADSSADGRLQAWYDGIWMLIHNPVFGIGMGNFLEEHGLVAHNSYIHVASELGVPGYSFWGGALIFSVFVSYILIKKHPTLTGDNTTEAQKMYYKAEFKILTTLFFSFAGFMITAFFLSRMFSLLLFIYLGMLMASHIRLFKIAPKLKVLYSLPNVYKCIGYSWFMIVLVYIALKVGL